MLLSIGMIVKNEEKYLSMCLEALKPILRNLDSELIIVDTGSTDKTVEIAKQYTDKVLYFEWIKDFAAARNHGLEQAQGEWFMFIDADEVLMSCDGIIDFFKSGEYKNYNSALYSIRNYESLKDKKEYTDMYLPRLTKILPETKFIRPVHEAFNTFGSPIMVLSDVAEHYGYAFEGDENLKEEKFRRNSELLKERLKTDYDYPLLYQQLFETYCFLDDKTEAVDYAYQGIEICKKQKSDFILAMYNSLMALWYNEKKPEEMLKVAQEYFAVDEEIRNGERTTDTDIIGFRALALYALERYEEAYEDFIKFFDLRDKFNNSQNVTSDVLFSMQRFKNEATVFRMNLMFTECCLKTKRYKQAEDNIKRIPVKFYEFDDNMYRYRFEQIAILLTSGECKDFYKIYSSHNKKEKSEIFNRLRFAIFSMADDKRRAILNRLSQEKLDTSLQNNTVSVLKAHFNGGAGESRIATFLDKFGANHADILCVMLKEGIDITPFLQKCENIIQVASDAYRCILGFNEVLQSYSPPTTNKKDCLYNLIVLYFYATLGAAENDFSMFVFVSHLSRFVMSYLELFGEADLPEEVVASITVAEIDMLRQMRNFKECIAAIRRLIQLNTRYAPIAKQYQKLIKDDMGG